MAGIFLMAASLCACGESSGGADAGIVADAFTDADAGTDADGGTIRITFDFSGAPPELDRTRVLSLNQLTGQVEETPLTGTTADGGHLDVTLAAGDVFLFKYKNGRPFALQR